MSNETDAVITILGSVSIFLSYFSLVWLNHLTNRIAPKVLSFISLVGFTITWIVATNRIDILTSIHK